ncbi:hypothetical protein C2G38_2142990 [Gigaspora rosea]|uniref:Uncharacterized protein n=1 Tax=Gigaspora rosea TaxID=44941 RepID=A0A397V4U5_9GLOM|nr:hypothetical protein C2G38_2142990 [Gigaspora rosea]
MCRYYSYLMMRIFQEISSSNMDTNTFEGKKLDMRNFKRIDIKANYNESQKINSNDNESKESGMTMMEKLEYEERMLMIAEGKEKLRELRISNVIKEREYGLEE